MFFAECGQVSPAVGYKAPHMITLPFNSFHADLSKSGKNRNVYFFSRKK